MIQPLSHNEDHEVLSMSWPWPIQHAHQPSS
jgi:hypothetical protein